MKIVFILGLLFVSTANADFIGYGDRNCNSVSEDRGQLRGREVCIVKISCVHYPLSNPNFGARVQQTVYCRPDSSNYCLDAQDCLEDNSLAPSDIPNITPKYDTDYEGSRNCAKKNNSGRSSSESVRGVN